VGKKTIRKIAAKDADQYMLRLPPGLRDRVARRAAENGRSMNTEIVEAIEKHLEGADRITQVWEKLKGHEQKLEDINLIRDAVLALQRAMNDSLRRQEEQRYANLPPITAEQVQQIRGLLSKTNTSEESLLEHLNVSSVEEIKEFERAMFVLRARGRLMRESGDSG